MKIRALSLRSSLFAALSVALGAAALTANASAQMRTVPFVDVNRYVGLWYEIARFENRFQRDCGATTAQYTKRSDGRIDVRNACVLPNGRVNVSNGVAKIADKNTNAKLKVTFLPAFLRWLSAIGIANGDYWVIDLGANYEYAVVSEPSRKFMWVLSRTPTMSRAVYEGILSRARGQYLDTTKLKITVPGSVR